MVLEMGLIGKTVSHEKAQFKTSDINVLKLALWNNKLERFSFSKYV